MKTRLLPFLLLCFTTLACAQSDIIPLSKKRSDDTLLHGFNTGAKTVKISATGTLEWVNGGTLTGASYFRTAAGLAIGTNVQAYDADLTTIAAMANAAGVLTNNGSGVFSYTATSTGGNGTDDSGKIAKFNTLGQIAGGFVGSFEAGPSYNFVAMDEGLRIGSETNAGTFGVPAGGGTSLVWTLPSVTGTFVTTGDTGSVTNTMLAGSIALTKLLQSSATSGQVIAWNGSAWAPTTISSGLTIGSTAISGGTSGRLLLSGTTLAELTLGSGVQTALGNTVNASGGLLTYGLIGTSGTKIPLLDGANTFAAIQTFAAGSVSAPSLTLGDSTTGIYRSGSNEFAVAIAGSQRLKVTDDKLVITGNDLGGNVLNLVSQYGTATFTVTGGGGLYFNSGANVNTAGFLSGAQPGNSANYTSIGYDSTSGLSVINGSSSTFTFGLASGSPTAKTISGTQADGSNVQGGDLNLGTRGTGTATSGSINLRAHAGGSSGSSLGTLVTKLSVSSAGTTVGVNGSAIAHIKRTTATLVAGTVTVTDADTTANTHVIITVSGSGGTPGDLSFTVSAGASYTVNSTSATDTRTITITAIHYP